MLRLKGLAEGSCTAITKAGTVEVQIGDNVWIKMPEPKFVGEAVMDFPSPSSTLAVVDVGLRIGIVEVTSFKELTRLQPTSNLADLCKNTGIDGVYAFTFDSKYDAAARFFAPALGVAEDPATGTAGAALAYYLHYSGRLVNEEYTFEQGHAMLREGVIHAKIEDGARVWVGGNAVCVLEGELRV
ncbi:PhzF family phenazine biosynthesis protein [Archaeoglobus veneficus]|uniref:PhzF family phenazine biosynthesis protein n=1 Tax=Archaeoglobus veneficus TaxID=58290 RepID=UPI000B1F3A1D|nr:PhzF family phenazine biosynthesis protein [Archaeoglobus veneficus]